MRRLTIAIGSCLVLAPPVCSQNWLGAPLELGTGTTFLAAVDLDGDGDTDLLGRSFDGLVAARLNSGIGSFVEAQPSFDPAPGPSVTDPNVGDVDGDGQADLVVLDAGGVALSLQTVPGQFADGVVYSVGASPADCVLGNVDADAELEVGVLLPAAGGTGADIGWFDWTGSGFSSLGLVNDPSGSASFGRLLAGDWNADGITDLATRNTSGTELNLYLTVSGTSSFLTSIQGASAGAFGGNAYTGDWNGDGFVDWLAVNATFGQAELTAFLNDGSGQPLPAVSNSTTDSIASSEIVVADWDGDGRDDLLTVPISVGGPATLTLRRSLGDGTFETGFSESRIAGNPELAGDFDGDGAMDLLKGVTLFFGTGTNETPYSADLDPFEVKKMRAVDWEGDGDLDLAFTGEFSDRFSIRVNDGTGTFASTGPLLPEEIGLQEYNADVLFEDVDGDGVRDLVASSSHVLTMGFQTIVTFLAEWRYLGNGASELVPDGNAAPPVGTDMLISEFSGVDYDGDGDLDIVEDGGRIWANDGIGSFSLVTSTLDTILLSGAGDVDGDGDQDLLTIEGTFANPEIVLQRNDGTGSFASESILLDPDVQPGVVRLVDVDDDGDQDVLGYVRFIGNIGTNQPFVMENVGGSFLAPVVLPTLAQITPQRFVLGDADLDGQTDVLALVNSGSTKTSVFVYRRIAGLDFESPRVFVCGATADLADLDADGDLDVIGSTLFESPLRDGVSGGVVQQYGASVAGSGGAEPLLGSTGALVVGETVELRMRHAVGGAAAILVLGSGPASVPELPFSGLTTLVGGSLSLFVLNLEGVPGAARQGSLDLPISVQAATAGTSRFLQLFSVDLASPNGLLTQSNGLRLSFGI